MRLLFLRKLKRIKLASELKALKPKDEDKLTQKLRENCDFIIDVLLRGH